MARILGDHLAVLSVFCGSFWLRKGLEFRIPLPADAPGLFAMLKNNGGTDQRVTGVGAGTSTISNDIAGRIETQTVGHTAFGMMWST